LCRCGYQAAEAEAPGTVEQIRVEAALSARILATQANLGAIESVELLQSALEDMLAGCRTRLFFLLSFLYDGQSILQARDNLSLASADKKAYALEVLDVLLSSDLKWLLPLLADSPADERGRQMNALFPQKAMSRQQRLEEIVANPSGQLSAWLRACALYATGASPDTAPAQAVSEAAKDGDPLVREMALWALRRLESAPLRRASSRLQPEAAVRSEATEGNGGKRMLTTVEKVIALKKAAVFAEVPDEVLAELAPFLEEVEYSAGETVFEKGELGDCMYLVFEGEIRIHDGDRTLNDLRDGAVFGEMALLDAELRSAAATAVADTLLLRLDQEPLFEVMEDRSEVARGIIRVLSQRLRARMSDLARLHQESEG